MRRSLAALAAVALAVIAVGALGPAAPAVAGGPTSVLITAPGAGDAAALYYTSADYAELEQMTSTGTPMSDPPPLGAMGEQTYHLTWMIHDVTPWRMDQISLDSPGGPWVATTLLLDQAPGETGEEPVWRQIPDGKALADLLNRVMAGESTPGAKTPIASAPSADAPEAQIVEVVEAAPWFALTGWRWVTPGLLLGAVLGFLVARRRRVGNGAPRGELVEPEREMTHAGHGDHQRTGLAS